MTAQPTYMIVANPAEDGDKLIAYGFGSLKAVNYLAKDALAAIKGQEGDFAMKITEVGSVGDVQAIRPVVSVTGEADVVLFVTKKKLAAERKAQGSTDADDTADAETDNTADADTTE